MGESSDLPLLASGGDRSASSATSPEAVLAQISGLSDEDRARLEAACATLRRTVEARARASEASLRQSEERFAKAFAASPDGLVISRLHDGTICEVNASFLQIFGLTREDAIGRRSTELELFADPQGRARALAVLRAEGRVRDLELLIRRRSGGLRTVLLSAEAIEVDDEPLLLTIVRDVTEGKRAAEAVRESEEQLAAFLEHSPSALFIKDAAGRYTVVNHAFLAAAGKAAHEVLGKTDHELYPPELAERFAAEDREVRECGKSRRYEETFAYDGRSCSLLSHKFPLPGGRIGGVTTDITERTAAEAALQSSEQAFRALYESMRDAFVSVDMDGTICQYNRSYQDLLGYSDEELAQLTYRDITPERWHALEERIVQEEVLPQGFSAVYEKEYRRKDGTIFPIELRTVLVTDAQGQPAQMWAIIRDITERKRVEERLRRVQAVTASFAAAQTLPEVNRVIRDDLLQALGASIVGLRLIQGGQLLLEDLTHSPAVPAATMQHYGALPLTARHPAAEVARSGAARFHRDVEAIVRAYPELAEAARAIPAQANAHLPLRRGDEVFGVLSLHFAEPRVWDEGEQAFALTLADRAAVAYERARLFEAERRSRERSERLQIVTAALSRAATPAEVYAAVLQHGAGGMGGATTDPALEAHSGTLFILAGETLILADGSGDPHPLLEQYRRIPLAAPVPAAEAVRSAEPVWLRSQADYIRQYPHLEDQIRQLPTEAAVSLPLRVEDRVLGTLNFTFAQPLTFDAGEQRYFRTLADQAAQALERSRLFASLQESEQRFRALSESGGMGVFFADESGAITDANPAFLNLLGLAEEDLRAGVTWRALTPPEWAAQDVEQARMLEAQGFVAPYEKEYLRRDGTRVPVLVGGTCVGAEGRTIVALVLDITERKQAEARLAAVARENQQLLAEEQRARAAAEAAVRLRDQFLSIASHELRTPLASVLGYAQLFQRQAASAGTLSERDQRSLRQIVTHAERLSRMIDTILDVSRIDQGRLRLEQAPLDLTALVHETIMAFDGTVPHQIIVTAAEEPCWVDGDALRLEQVLHNLLGNAIKYSPGGGTVMVVIAPYEETVQVLVQDAGIGIPAADVPHIFERFYRAGNVSADTISGVGIGLFVVHEIVTLHGGTITVTSEEGLGSSFTVTLPRAAGLSGGGEG